MLSVKYRSGLSSLRMAISRRLLDFILRGRDVGALPRHVLLPGDEVSSELLVAGIHEGALLQPLFDHFLRAQQSIFRERVALDVGANIGNHSLFFSRYFKRVIAVEPNPLTLHVLRANAALSGADIDVLPMGFAAEAAQLTFYSNREGNLGASGFAFAGGPTSAGSGESISCPVERGDDVLARMGVAPLGLIKLDVEGAELSALHGLRQRLENDKPCVIFESLRSEGEGGGAEIFAFLGSVGYRQFFAVESDVGTARRSVLGWIRRLTRGEHVHLRALTEPEAGRAYLMILALPDGIKPGADLPA